MRDREITIRDLADVFTSHIPVLLLAFVLGTGLSYLYYRNYVTPEYSSEAVLYVLRNLESSGEDDYPDSYDQEIEFTLAQYIMDDCVTLIKSRKVVQSVIDELEQDTTYSEFIKHVTIENPLNSRLINITVTGETPEKAKEVVDAICTAGKNSIEEFMGRDRVSIYDEGNLNDWPVNQWKPILFAAFGLIASILAYAAALFINISKGIIRRDSDIERCLGIKVLGNLRKTDLL